MSFHGGSRGAPSVPWVTMNRIPRCCSMLYEYPWRIQRCSQCPKLVGIQDPRVLFNALWVVMEGPEVLQVPHELLFRVPGCCSMLYDWSWRVQRCSQCPMCCYSGSQGAVQCFMSGLGGSRGAPCASWVAIQDPRVLLYALTLTSNVIWNTIWSLRITKSIFRQNKWKSLIGQLTN